MRLPHPASDGPDEDAKRPVPANESKLGAASDVERMIHQMQQQLRGTKKKNEDELVENEDEDVEDSAPAPKAKSKKKVQAAAKAAPQRTHTMDSATLAYTGVKAHRPCHYGLCTLYADVGKHSWRLNLNPGDKHEVWYKWDPSKSKSANGRQVWNQAVAHVIRHNTKMKKK